MKRLVLFAAVLAVWWVSLSGVGWGASGEAVTRPRFAGIWLGTLRATGVELRVAFEITETGDAGYRAKLHDIDNSNMNVPIATVSVRDNEVRLEIPSFFIYEGRLQPDGDTLQGTFKQSLAVLPLALKRVDRLPGFHRPQTPQPPYPYREEEVRYRGGGEGITLAGTLTLPRGKGPFPVVLLLAGSGPLNRDEEVFFHRPFLLLADHLTRRGIAVLRVDKRGVGASSGDFAQATAGDFTEDALAGLAFLKSRKELDPRRLGLIGHSEGAVVGAAVAARAPEVSFLVMLAGPGQWLGDVVTFQRVLEAKTRGADEARAALVQFWNARVLRLVADAQDPATAEKRIRELQATLTAEEKRRLGVTDELLADQIASTLSPWWWYSLRHDSRDDLRKVTCPVLVLNGEKDMQVTAKENLALVGEALQAGGNRHVTVRELPGLNHLFQRCDRGLESEYIKIEETMAPVALQTVSDWVTARAR